jgi:hypothetical protein
MVIVKRPFLDVVRDVGGLATPAGFQITNSAERARKNTALGGGDQKGHGHIGQ